MLEEKDNIFPMTNETYLIERDSNGELTLCRFVPGVSLSDVIVPDGIEKIRENAFKGSDCITSVVIPEGVKEIGDFAFGMCGSLRSVRLPLTAMFTDRSFYKLADKGNVTYGRSMFGFSGSISIAELSRSLLDLAFKNNEQAISDISENTEGFLRIILRRRGGNFKRDIEKLSELLPSVKEKIKTKDGIYTVLELDEYGESYLLGFKRGSAAEKVIIPEGVTHIAGYAFCCRNNIESIRFPLSLRYIGESAFDRCGGLKEVTLPETIVEIGGGAFSCCKSLRYAEIKNGKALFGRGIFYECGSLSEVALPENMTEIPSKMFFLCGSLEKISLPKSLTTIGESAFGMTSLSTVVVPEGVKEIGEKAFVRCYELKSAGLPSSLIKTGNGIFDECTELIDLSMTLNEKLDLFYDYRCIAGNDNPSLNRVNVNGSYFVISGKLDTSFFRGIANELAQNGDPAAAAVMKNLTPEVDKLSKLKGQEKFKLHIETDENGNEYIYVDGIAENVHTYEARIPDGVTNIGKDAFYRCDSITRLCVPESVRYYSYSAFKENGIEEIVLEGGIYELYENMFADCKKLRKPVLPDGLRIIGKGAFYGCTSLAAIIIPDTVKLIRLGAFLNCKKLRSVKLPLCRLIDSDSTLARPFGNCDNLELAIIEGKEYHLDGELDMKFMSMIAADLLHDGNTNARIFMQENGEYVLKQLIKCGDNERIERLLSEFDSFTTEQIDRSIERSLKTEHHEIYLLLVGYKRDKLGFGDTSGRFDL